MLSVIFFFFSSRRRHTRFDCDWSSDVCSSDLRNLAKIPSAGYPANFARQSKIPDFWPASSPHARPKSSNWADPSWEGGPRIEASRPGQNAWASRLKTSRTIDDEGSNHSGCRQLDLDCPGFCECPFADSCRNPSASTSEVLSSLRTVRRHKFRRSSCFLRQRG